MKVLQAPSFTHPFGTDALGRDLFSRILYGTRYSYLIALSSILLSSLGGITLGVTAAYVGGKIEEGIMAFLEVFLTFPTLLMAIIIVSIMGPGVAGLIVAIAVSFAPRLARLSRSKVLQVKEEDYVRAANSIGASDVRILLIHILPNSLAPIFVQVTLRTGQAILVAAALGFLGLGVSPPTPEWGVIMSRGRAYLAMAPHIVMLTGLAISLSVLGFSLLGDGLRDVVDPKEK